MSGAPDEPGSPLLRPAHPGDNYTVTDIPRRATQRTARLASLPLGVAGRVAAAWGKRLTGHNAHEVNAELNARTAEQLFAVLGELKGGAMKLGQALSVFEAAIPDQLAAPYREALTKLQSAAPPMSPQSVRRVLDEQLGSGWPRRFREFSEEPAAAASIGQVHRAVWHDGREVAVKVQYPGADEALRSDLRQLQRFSRLFQAIVPGMEVKPLLTELRDRMVEELDYRDEANNQREFAAAFRGHPEIAVPAIVASAPKVMVSQWVTGTPMAQIIRDGSQSERDDIGTKLSLFHSSSPTRTGLLHADPHPGNFLRLNDGRLGVLDFGAAAKLPGGAPRTLGVAIRLAVEERSEELLELLRSAGFVRPGMPLRAEDVLAYLGPFADPLRTETFHFTRAWMQAQAERVGDFSSPDFRTGRALNLPPSYLLIHRVSTGTFGVLCQLDATVPLRGIAQRWQPGFAS
ncbi:MAG: AarF/ABC1/UbiB kinase family protein [Pseudonocardiales bacterium]|nr:AarF/ABC1/UbiB kinase family protein [Pseudonocardiales bacterium]